MSRASGGLHVDRAHCNANGCTLMALPAGLREISGVDGGARIIRAKYIVYAVTGGAVCGAQRAFAKRQSMVTVGVGGNAIGRQIVPLSELSVAVAAATRFIRNIRYANRRRRI